MAYTTKAKVDALTGGNIDSALFTTLLASVKAFIDRYCGKTFEGVSETRYYDGNGLKEILVDSFTGTPTEVSILNSDGTTYDTITEGQANDYVALPLNSSEKNVIRLTGNGYWANFASRGRVLKVVATFGASASVPADIEYVATKLVANLGGESESLNIKSESLGDYSVSYDDIDDDARAMGVMTILDMYRDIDI